MPPLPRLRDLDPSKVWRSFRSQKTSRVTTIGLGALPDEILCIIINLLTPDERDRGTRQVRGFELSQTYNHPTDLLSLLRCNNRLYNIITPYIYTTFTQCNPLSYVPFIQATLSHRDLAYLVKHINLTDERPYWSITRETQQLTHIALWNIMSYYIESRRINTKNLASQAASSESPSSEENNMQLFPDEPSLVNGITIGDIVKRAAERKFNHGNPVQLDELEERISRGGRLENFRKKFNYHSAVYKSPTLLTYSPPRNQTTLTLLAYLTDGRINALLIFFLYTLPNVESITLTLEYQRYLRSYIDPNPEPHETDVMFPDYVGPSSIVLEKLHTFTLNYLERTEQSEFKYFVHLLLQPSLRHFNASNIEQKLWAPPSPDTQFPMTHLTLNTSNLSTAALASFLSACPHLTHLSYTHVRYISSESSFRPAAFSQSIAHLRDQLTHLTLIRRPHDVHSTMPRYEFEFSVLDLKAFKQLVEVHVTAQLLVGGWHEGEGGMYDWEMKERVIELGKGRLGDALPDGGGVLKKLVLRSCERRFMNEVVALLKQRKSGEGRLKGVRDVEIWLPGERHEMVGVWVGHEEVSAWEEAGLRCFWEGNSANCVNMYNL